MVAVSVLTLGAQAPVDIPKLDDEKYSLSNGLEVILRKAIRADHRRQRLVPRGPGEEAAGRTGFAHLFEHMMFQGWGHVGAIRTSNFWKAPAPRA